MLAKSGGPTNFLAGRRGHDRELPPSTSLVALAGERARAVIGTRVRLTLIGPGRVSVLPAPHAGDLELALKGERLLVDYDGRARDAESLQAFATVQVAFSTSMSANFTRSPRFFAPAAIRVIVSAVHLASTKADQAQALHNRLIGLRRAAVRSLP